MSAAKRDASREVGHQVQVYDPQLKRWLRLVSVMGPDTRTSADAVMASKRAAAKAAKYRLVRVVESYEIVDEG